MNKFEMELNENKAKAFFFRHGEKLLLGFGAICMGLFCYFGMGLAPEKEYKPSDTQKAVKSAKDWIDRPVWDDMKAHRTVVKDGPAQFKKNRGNIDGALYASTGFSAVRKEGQPKRRDPEVFAAINPVIDVVRATTVAKTKRAEGELHLLQQLPTAAAEDITVNTKASVDVPGLDTAEAGTNDVSQYDPAVKYFVGVRYVVPFKKMVQSYKDAFDGTRGGDAELDKPIFGYMEIQRKTNGGQWADITDRIKKENSEYAATCPELVVEETINEPLLTGPVPPIVAADFSKLSVHPDLKLLEPENDQKNNSNSRSKTSNALQNDREAQMADPGHHEPEYKLVRFVDTQVKPGESYQYRVRLWYFDPNNPRPLEKPKDEKKSGNKQKQEKGGGKGDMGGSIGGGFAQMADTSSRKTDSEDDLKKLEAKVTINQVEDDVRQRLNAQLALERPKPYLIRFRPAEWSSATPVATVSPVVGEVVVSEANPKLEWRYTGKVGNKEYEVRGDKKEASLKLLAAQWDERFGIRVPVLADNLFVGDLVVGEGHGTIWDPMSETYRYIYNFDGTIPSKKTEKRNAFYRSNSGHALVDFIGGQALDGVTEAKKKTESFAEPLEVLLVDEAGNLKVQSRQSDRATYTWMTGQVDTESKAKKPKDNEGKGGLGKGGLGGKG